MKRIRTATQGDLDGMICLQRQAIAGITCGYTDCQLAAWSQSTFRRRFQLVQAIEQVQVYLGEISGFVASYAEVGAGHDSLVALYTRPEFSRQGLGTELLDAVESTCRSAGAGKLRVCSALNAVSFYVRRGFDYQRDAEMILSTGERLSCVHLSKRLGD